MPSKAANSTEVSRNAATVGRGHTRTESVEHCVNRNDHRVDQREGDSLGLINARYERPSPSTPLLTP